MEIFEINEALRIKLDSVQAKPNFVISHFPNFNGDLIVIRDAEGTLMWRSHAFETDFLFELDKALDYYATPKAAAEIAEAAATRRASQLRLEALFFQQGFDDFDLVASGQFTRAEVEAEIAAITPADKAADAAKMLEAVRLHIVTAHTMRTNGASVSDAMIYTSGMCETLLSSPFELDGFAKALAHMFNTPNTCELFLAALSYDGDAWVFDTRRMQVKTNAGVTYIAPAWSVRLFPGLERCAAYWDMRDGLIRNEQFYKTLNADTIKAIDYVG
jgi:hypothetical protein